MRTGRWRGSLDREITEPRWHCVTLELITEQGLTVGIAALQVVVGAFRRAKRSQGQREREREITEQGRN